MHLKWTHLAKDCCTSPGIVPKAEPNRSALAGPTRILRHLGCAIVDTMVSFVASLTIGVPSIVLSAAQVTHVPSRIRGPANCNPKPPDTIRTPLSPSGLECFIGRERLIESVVLLKYPPNTAGAPSSVKQLPASRNPVSAL